MRTRMKINEIRREVHRLKRTIEKQPRIWKFHGRRVVNADEWKWGDWSKLPDSYSILIIYGKSVPDDYLRDYAELNTSTGTTTTGIPAHHTRLQPRT